MASKRLVQVTEHLKREQMPPDKTLDGVALPPPKERTTEEKWQEKPRGIQPGTSDQVTPLKHVQMYRKHFTQNNLKQAVRYIESEGRDEVPPIFLTYPTAGEWSIKGGSLYWQALDGSTALLRVVPAEEAEKFIEMAWYKQDVPSGIFSLHTYLKKRFLGISRAAVKQFVQRQKPWQMIAPKRDKAKFRVSQLAKRPFTHVEIDLADFESFAQRPYGSEGYRFVLVVVDNFSGFCLAELQQDKTAKETLANFKKCLAAIAQLGYGPVRVLKSDQGGEFAGPPWDALGDKYKWFRQWSKNYPCVRVERKIQTLKRYMRLNSTLTRGPGTFWWNVLTPSVVAINNIAGKQGLSPFEIVLADRQKHSELHKDKKKLRDASHKKAYKQAKNEPKVGDTCRVSLLSEKERPRDFKGHLAYDKNGLPIKWSDELYTVEKIRTNRVLGSVKVFAHERWRFWPSEVLIVPATTVASAVWGEDGNVDFEQQAQKPVRRSARRRIPVQRMDL